MNKTKIPTVDKVTFPLRLTPNVYKNFFQQLDIINKQHYNPLAKNVKTHLT